MVSAAANCFSSPSTASSGTSTSTVAILLSDVVHTFSLVMHYTSAVLMSWHQASRLPNLLLLL